MFQLPAYSKFDGKMVGIFQGSCEERKDSYSLKTTFFLERHYAPWCTGKLYFETSEAKDRR